MGNVVELAIPGAFLAQNNVFHDQRGLFTTPLSVPEFETAAQTPFPPLQQASFSRSAAGVARGIHFTRTPPGGQKYVWCAAGAVQDFVVDLRDGSPTYLTWVEVELTSTNGRALFLPTGVGHAYVSQEEGSVVCYLMSKTYRAEDELAVSLLDLGIGLPVSREVVLSHRDQVAPTVAQAEREGILPL